MENEDTVMILIVEDDFFYARIVAEYLVDNGLDSHIVRSTASLIDRYA